MTALFPDDHIVARNEADIRHGIELLYFAYTRLYRGIDEGLAAQGLGRAHHRALYFIGRQPGLNVSELLRILAITKQSLARVINDLAARGFVATEQGQADRRQRLLRLTEAGAAFEASLFDPLRASMTRAYGEAGNAALDGFWGVLAGLVPPDERDMVGPNIAS
ncbi:MarR family winged helix-turn-helix transcriptional regulator [Aquisediminimonas sediminicola]|uniref:MarR family winged helix-turn-helix transcriptional regulator n=1 Tax=Alteraquisediminimonas sediminicola TaxID=2676787 RepID=UPI001C8CF897|nr:MarR family transcriptional regulator [Aquisediminimonas sediminicola]